MRDEVFSKLKQGVKEMSAEIKTIKTYEPDFRLYKLEIYLYEDELNDYIPQLNDNENPYTITRLETSTI